MTTPTRQLTIDEALAEFQSVLREKFGDPTPHRGMRPETAEEAEARRFHMAEVLLSLACPDPTACTDQHCRRDRVCRHFARLRAKEQSRASRHPRRTAGAEAARYAIWVYMNCGR